jgi:hypothetical protein
MAGQSMGGKARIKIIRQRILELTDEMSPELDEFIIRHGGSPFHEIAFNRIAAEYFGTDAIVVLAYEAKEKLVGICTIHYNNRGMLKIGYSGLCNNEVPYGGWIYNPEAVGIADLMQYTTAGWNEKIYYYTNICLEPEAYYKHAGFDEKSTVVVDLSKDLDEYFEQGINSHTRNKIRKAQKSGVEIKHLTPDEMFKFQGLSGELKDRLGMPNEFEFYRRIHQYFNSKNRGTCIAAVYAGEIISAGIMLSNQNLSVGWVAARKNELPSSLYQNELLFWESIIWSKGKSCRYFDLSGLEEQRLPHLARIKLSISNDVRHFYATTLQNLPVRALNRIQGSRG